VTPPLTSRFDPREWDRIYGESPSGLSAIFQRSAEVAGNLVLESRAAGRRWLDVGCGTGRLTERLAAHGVDVIGIDADPAMIRHARERAIAAGRQLSYAVSTAEKLPFPDASVEGVVAVSLIGCLESSPAFYKEVVRVLKPDGAAVLTYTNGASWLLRLNYAMTGKRRGVGGGEGGEALSGTGGEADGGPGGEALSGRGAPAAGGTFRLFTERQARQDLADAGLLVERIRYYNVMLVFGGRLFPPRRFWERLECFKGPPVSRLARNFAAVVRKR
jgi:SAM-dependent methyltransferase